MPRMAFPVFIQRRYQSRYGLLGAMAEELAAAFAARGCPVDPDEPVGARPGLMVWFNTPPSMDAIPLAARSPGSRVALVQFFVDHPLALNEAMMDGLAGLPNYRLLLPSVDGLHLLRLRWPGLRHGHALHAVPRAALCERVDGERPTDVVAMGSAHTEEELESMRASLPEPLRRPADEMVAMLVREPRMAFEQALDVSLGSRGVVTGQWSLAAAVWRYVVAAANRRRRLAMLSALRGLNVDVWGTPGLADGCSGSVRYRGEFAYSDSAAIMRGAKVCLAWGPTQFAHSFSERVLLAMAAGCAAVADDRLLLRARLGEAVELFDGADPASGRAAIESLLADEGRRLSLATRGRALVEAGHLWEHRLQTLGAAGAEAIAA